MKFWQRVPRTSTWTFGPLPFDIANATEWTVYWHLRYQEAKFETLYERPTRHVEGKLATFQQINYPCQSNSYFISVSLFNSTKIHWKSIFLVNKCKLHNKIIGIISFISNSISISKIDTNLVSKVSSKIHSAVAAASVVLGQDGGRESAQHDP